MSAKLAGTVRQSQNNSISFTTLTLDLFSRPSLLVVENMDHSLLILTRMCEDAPSFSLIEQESTRMFTCSKCCCKRYSKQATIRRPSLFLTLSEPTVIKLCMMIDRAIIMTYLTVIVFFSVHIIAAICLSNAPVTCGCRTHLLHHFSVQLNYLYQTLFPFQKLFPSRRLAWQLSFSLLVSFSSTTHPGRFAERRNQWLGPE